MPIGFGIVGCGMISRFHAKAIADLSGAKLVACTSSRPETAKVFASEFGCKAYPTVNELVDADDVHVVSICTPSGAHQEPAVAAARAGKHVVVEKPLEVTLKRCDAIINACQKFNVKLATVFPSRFHACWRELKTAIDRGKFGTLSLADAYIKWFRTQEYYDSGTWRGTWKLDGGGALMNQAIHTIDLLQWLMGPIESIAAMTATLAHKRIEVEDTAVANVQFANGALGSIEATTASFPGALKKIEVHGSHGSAIIEEEDIRQWQFQKMTAADQRIIERFGCQTQTGGGASDPAAIGHAAHRELFRDFLKAIKTDSLPAIDGVEGRKSVEIILAIYKAAKTGKRIKLT
ncbi:MAG: Gfo/Idh/MocA family oxidoreductase [Pirellulaceae bacterium]